jgi:TolB protein
VDRRLFTLLEIVAIGGLILAVLYFGGIFDRPPRPSPVPQPAPTLRGVFFEPSLEPPRPTRAPTLVEASPPASEQPTRPPLTQPSGQIAFESTRAGNHEIYLMNADGSGQTNLTRHPDDDYLLSWAPDGARLAFFSTRTGWLELYVMDPDGSDVIQLTDTRASNTAFYWPISWTQDGHAILAARTTPWMTANANTERDTTLELIRADGSDRTPLFESARGWLWKPGVSPDGTYLAAMMEDGGGLRTYTGRIAENKVEWQGVGLDCIAYVFGPGLGRLTCYDGRGLVTMNPDGLDRKVLVEDISGWPDHMAWSSDSAFLLVAGRNFDAAPDALRQRLLLVSTTRNVSWEREIPYADTLTLSWAPDSQWVALAAPEKVGGDRSVYITNIYDAAQSRDLTGDSGDNFNPQWQP